MTLCGDAMLSRPLDLYTEPDYLRMLDFIRTGDVRFANLETTVRHGDEGWPIRTMGTPMSTDPARLTDLHWMGINLVSVANNHATDYGPLGILATVRHLDAAGIPFAGIGAHLAAAAAPAFLDTEAGRIGMVAATAFFPPESKAGHQRPDAMGRPGVNTIAFSRTHIVPRPAFDMLSEMDRGLGFAAERLRRSKEFFSASEVGGGSADQLTLHGVQYRVGEGYGSTTTANAADLRRLTASIREARAQSDYVVFSFHWHEIEPDAKAQDTVELDRPADFVESVARAAIDAGADVVVGHGPHVTMGIEVYRGKPILYSLGNFVFHNETLTDIPADSYERFGLGWDARPSEFFDARTDSDRKGFPAAAEYWESWVARVRFEGSGLAALEVLPIELGHGQPRVRRGRPRHAGDKAQCRILQRLQHLSQRYSTRFEPTPTGAIVRL